MNKARPGLPNRDGPKTEPALGEDPATVNHTPPQQPWQRPHTYETAGDGRCVLCDQAEKEGMWHAPHAGFIPHVYIPKEGRGAGPCMCGQPRFHGLHTANDGTPEPDLTGIAEAVQQIQTQLNTIRRILKDQR